MMDRKNFLKIYWKKISSFATLIAFIASSSAFAEFPWSEAQDPAAPPSVIRKECLHVPSELGTIESIHVASEDGPFIVLIRDAHAVIDAQNHIEQLISHFQVNYGINLIALEGGKDKLDPTLFRTFPVKGLVRKILGKYVAQGELSGPQMAAIFNSREGNYRGIEDWDLYVKNYSAYRNAAAERERAASVLARSRAALDAKRRSVYGPEHNVLHENALEFLRGETSLLDLTTCLMSFGQADPALYPELCKFFTAVRDRKNTRSAGLTRAVRGLADDFKRAHLSERTQADTRNFNGRYQEWMTGVLGTDGFLKFLVDFANSSLVSLALTDEMNAALAGIETVSSIRGTELFAEIESLTRKLEGRFSRSPAEAELSVSFRRLDILDRLIKLEADRDDYASFEKDAPDFRTLLDDPSVLEPALAFYRCALDRDGALWSRLSELLASDNSASAIVVLGGFHTAGFEKELRSRHLNYAVVRPRIASLSGQERYHEIMKGKLSYNAKIHSTPYDAFARQSLEELTSGLSGPDLKRTLKIWRNEILRRLASERRLDQAGRYTRYLDEILRKSIEKFGGKRISGKDREALLHKIGKILQKTRGEILSRLNGPFRSPMSIIPEGTRAAALTPRLVLDPSIPALPDSLRSPGQENMKAASLGKDRDGDFPAPDLAAVLRESEFEYERPGSRIIYSRDIRFEFSSEGALLLSYDPSDVDRPWQEEFLELSIELDALKWTLARHLLSYPAKSNPELNASLEKGLRETSSEYLDELSLDHIKTVLSKNGFAKVMAKDPALRKMEDRLNNGSLLFQRLIRHRNGEAELIRLAASRRMTQIAGALKRLGSAPSPSVNVYVRNWAGRGSLGTARLLAEGLVHRAPDLRINIYIVADPGTASDLKLTGARTRETEREIESEVPGLPGIKFFWLKNAAGDEWRPGANARIHINIDSRLNVRKFADPDRDTVIDFNVMPASQGFHWPKISHYTQKITDDLQDPFGTIYLDTGLRKRRNERDTWTPGQMIEARSTWLDRIFAIAPRPQRLQTLKDLAHREGWEPEKAIWTWGYFQDTGSFDAGLTELAEAFSGENAGNMPFIEGGRQLLFHLVPGTWAKSLADGDERLSPANLAALLREKGMTVLTPEGEVLAPDPLRKVPVTIVLYPSIDNTELKTLCAELSGSLVKSSSTAKEFFIDFPAFVTGTSSWLEALSAQSIFLHDNFDCSENLKRGILRSVIVKELAFLDAHAYEDVGELQSRADILVNELLMSTGTHLSGYKDLEAWTLKARALSNAMFRFNTVDDILIQLADAQGQRTDGASLGSTSGSTAGNPAFTGLRFEYEKEGGKIVYAGTTRAEYDPQGRLISAYAPEDADRPWQEELLSLNVELDRLRRETAEWLITCDAGNRESYKDYLELLSDEEDDDLALSALENKLRKKGFPSTSEDRDRLKEITSRLMAGHLLLSQLIACRNSSAPLMRRAATERADRIHEALARLGASKEPVVNIFVKNVIAEGFLGMSRLLAESLAHRCPRLRVNVIVIQAKDSKDTRAMRIGESHEPNIRFWKIGESRRFSWKDRHPADLDIGIGLKSDYWRSSDDVIRFRALPYAAGYNHDYLPSYRHRASNDLENPWGTLFLDTRFRERRKKRDAWNPETMIRERSAWLSGTLPPRSHPGRALAVLSAREGWGATNAIWTWGYFQDTQRFLLEIDELASAFSPENAGSIPFAPGGRQLLFHLVPGKWAKSPSNPLMRLSADEAASLLAEKGITVIDPDGKTHEPVSSPKIPVTVILYNAIPHDKLQTLQTELSGTLIKTRTEYSEFYVDFPAFVTGTASHWEAVSTGAIHLHDGFDVQEGNGRNNLLHLFVRTLALEDESGKKKMVALREEARKKASGFLMGEPGHRQKYGDLESWTREARELSDALFRFNTADDLLIELADTLEGDNAQATPFIAPSDGHGRESGSSLGLRYPDGADLAYLGSEWAELFRRVNARGNPEDPFSAITGRYSETGRFYHTLSHIEIMLKELEASGIRPADRDALEFAIWFHDVFYDTTAGDNEERSAEYAAAQLRAFGMDPGFIAKVEALILATKFHRGGSGVPDADLIIDLDLSLLAVNDGHYEAFVEEAIRKEYLWVPDSRFITGRAEVLRKFLEQPVLFNHDHFRDRHERTARKNLARTVEWLEEAEAILPGLITSTDGSSFSLLDYVASGLRTAFYAGRFEDFSEKEADTLSHGAGIFDRVVLLVTPDETGDPKAVQEKVDRIFEKFRHAKGIAVVGLRDAAQVIALMQITHSSTILRRLRKVPPPPGQLEAESATARENYERFGLETVFLVSSNEHLDLSDEVLAPYKAGFRKSTALPPSSDENDATFTACVRQYNAKRREVSKLPPVDASTAFYAGSFDPVTNGHMEVIARAGRIFAKVYVGIGPNPSKNPVFDTKERRAMLEAAIREYGLKNVEVMDYDGLTVEAARSVNAGTLIRGARDIKDLEGELPLAWANRLLDDDISTLLMVPYQFRDVSSSLVKKTASEGKDIAGLVPGNVREAMRARGILKQAPGTAAEAQSLGERERILDERLNFGRVINEFIALQENEDDRTLLAGILRSKDFASWYLSGSPPDAEFRMPRALPESRIFRLEAQLNALSLYGLAQIGAARQDYRASWDDGRQSLTLSRMPSPAHAALPDVDDRTIQAFLDIASGTKSYRSAFHGTIRRAALLVHNSDFVPLLREYIENFTRFGHEGISFYIFDDSNDAGQSARQRQAQDLLRQAGVDFVYFDKARRDEKRAELKRTLVSQGSTPGNADRYVDSALGEGRGEGAARNWAMLMLGRKNFVVIDHDVFPRTAVKDWGGGSGGPRIFPVDVLTVLNRSLSKPKALAASYRFSGNVDTSALNSLEESAHALTSGSPILSSPRSLDELTQVEAKEDERLQGGLMAIRGLEENGLPVPSAPQADNWLRYSDLIIGFLQSRIRSFSETPFNSNLERFITTGGLVTHDHYPDNRSADEYARTILNEQIGIHFFCTPLLLAFMDAVPDYWLRKQTEPEADELLLLGILGKMLDEPVRFLKLVVNGLMDNNDPGSFMDDMERLKGLHAQPVLREGTKEIIESVFRQLGWEFYLTHDFSGKLNVDAIVRILEPELKLFACTLEGWPHLVKAALTVPRGEIPAASLGAAVPQGPVLSETGVNVLFERVLGDIRRKIRSVKTEEELFLWLQSASGLKRTLDSIEPLIGPERAASLVSEIQTACGIVPDIPNDRSLIERLSADAVKLLAMEPVRFFEAVQSALSEWLQNPERDTELESKLKLDDGDPFLALPEFTAIALDISLLAATVKQASDPLSIQSALSALIRETRILLPYPREFEMLANELLRNIPGVGIVRYDEKNPLNARKLNIGGESSVIAVSTATTIRIPTRSALKERGISVNPALLTASGLDPSSAIRILCLTVASRLRYQLKDRGESRFPEMDEALLANVIGLLNALAATNAARQAIARAA